MQNYINPIELLKLNSEISESNNDFEIQKAKKRLIAEIELSDSFSINFNGQELTKSDCLKAINELDDNEKKDFHLFIYQNTELNNFLTSGDLSFFERYQFESIYKSAEFLVFISPYFSQQYSKVLSKAFRLKKTKQLKEIFLVDPIVNENFHESCYKSIYSLIRNIEEELKILDNEIENNEDKYVKNGFKELEGNIRKKIDVELLNLLPSYFQTVRNNVAHSLRNISVTINNKPFNDYAVAFDLATLAYSLDIDGLIKQTVMKNYFITKKNYESGVIIVEKIDSSSIQIPVSKSDNPEEEITIGTKISHGIWFLVLIVALFNHTVQLVVLGISACYFLYRVYFFFKEPENFKDSKLLKKISFIGLGILTISGFFHLFAALLFVSNVLLDGLMGVFIKKNGDRGEENARLIMCFIISFFLALGIYDKYYDNHIFGNNQSYLNNVTSSNLPSVPITPSKNIDTNVLDTTQSTKFKITQAPAYVYPLVKNGNITGCDRLKERYNRDLNNRLEITCGNNSSVVVKLVNSSSDKTIRYVFINKNSTYTVRNIPEGKYYLKIGYGNAWAIKEGESICEGRFTNNTLFKKGEDILDFNLVKTKRGFQVPSFSLKLDVVQTEEGMNNFNANKINENDFYNE